MISSINFFVSLFQLLVKAKAVDAITENYYFRYGILLIYGRLRHGNRQ